MKEPSESQDEPIAVLRVGMDGQWTAHELYASLYSIEYFYNAILFLQLCAYQTFISDFREYLRNEFATLRPFEEDTPREVMGAGGPVGFALEDATRLSQLIIALAPHLLLNVRRIQYGSPGFKDLAGAGEIVGHVKDFLLKLIDLAVTTRQRRLDVTERNVEIEAKRIENLKAFVELAKGIGFSEHEIRTMLKSADVHQDNLMQLALQMKIVTVEKVDDHPTKNT